MLTIRVDDNEIQVEEGRTLLQALDDAGLLMNGVDVPHYCWHPKLPIDGSCRLCQVEVEGIPKLQIACNTPVEDGMVVHTQSDRVRAARAGVMELLLVNHPLDCPICDQAGECKLQDYAFAYGVDASRTREPRRALKKSVALGPTIVFDQERCILCRRYVRFCRDVTGTGELGVVNRGDRSVIETFPGVELDNPYSMNVADICPVGALTTRDFRFKIRVWFLEDVPGICTGCSRGCNIWLGVSKGEVQRYTPRRNDSVNGTWICDAGRLSYKEIAAPDRLRQPLLRADDGVLRGSDLSTAVGAAAQRLLALVEAKGPGVVAMLASAHATNEDLAALRRLADGLGVDAIGLAAVVGDGDDLLLRPEKGANAAGARDAGFGDPGPVFERLRGGGLEALLVLGHDLLHPTLLGGVDALADLDTLVVLDTHRSDLERVADVVIPGRHAAEKSATLTNFAGVVQEVVPAVEPPFPAWAEADILDQLGQALRRGGDTLGEDA
jgi:NADH-quinone oxidoreductase subunit G